MERFKGVTKYLGVDNYKVFPLLCIAKTIYLNKIRDAAMIKDVT